MPSASFTQSRPRLGASTSGTHRQPSCMRRAAEAAPDVAAAQNRSRESWTQPAASARGAAAASAISASEQRRAAPILPRQLALWSCRVRRSLTEGILASKGKESCGFRESSAPRQVQVQDFAHLSPGMDGLCTIPGPARGLNLLHLQHESGGLQRPPRPANGRSQLTAEAVIPSSLSLSASVIVFLNQDVHPVSYATRPRPPCLCPPAA
jgi:hypothetical protein